MYYRHDLTYNYPERSDEHMITVKHLRDVNLDQNYPYLQKGFWFGCQRALLQVVMWGVMPWLLPITHGLKIDGREHLKNHKDLLKDGAITISNHVFMWDYLCVLRAVRPRLMFFPAWKTNLEGPNGPLIRIAGGIPIPTQNLRSMVCFKRAMEEVLQSNRWMHFFPEGSLWFFYPDIRPLKKAVFQYAVQYNRPIVPITMSFRRRRGITRLFTKTPCVNLHVGEPLTHNPDLGKKEAIEELHARAYHVMQGMNGIHPNDPTYNIDQNIDHYQKTM